MIRISVFLIPVSAFALLFVYRFLPVLTFTSTGEPQSISTYFFLYPTIGPGSGSSEASLSIFGGGGGGALGFPMNLDSGSVLIVCYERHSLHCELFISAPFSHAHPSLSPFQGIPAGRSRTYIYKVQRLIITAEHYLEQSTAIKR